ncbi:Aldo reductase [Venustampulla echinocandica]|uniref:Aldo reductase n=1 Tax=Venustampulla echinocandica TaxID=2656787 RepID=A0A370TDD6_9HELO|nr:Aldo reductase [Venustampulla echinocandica]RDL32480.1 Aldo reductase [Venustampulla echinocandica]
MSPPKYFPLKVSGGGRIDIPSVGFGTFAADGPGWCKDAVLTALKSGYRHLDCAWIYGVDEEIGQAIRESGIPRSEIFITSKAWPHFYAPENMELNLDLVLKQMGIDYIDLWLAHWPYAAMPISREALEKASPKREERGQLIEDGKPVKDWAHTSTNIAKQAGKEGSFVPTWKAMEELVKKGKARAIGLSNFSIAELEAIIPHAEIPISCNQIEVHPWLPQNALVEFGKNNGILTTCFSPFAGQKADGSTLLRDENVLKLAEKNGMDVGQLLQSWAVQRGTLPLGKSSTPSRIKSNLDIKKLSDEVMKDLDTMDIGGAGRTIDYTEAWGVPLFTN